MTPPRSHALITAYTILFTTAAGIVGYGLCTHRPPALPDFPIASARIERIAPLAPQSAAPLAAVETSQSDTAKTAKSASVPSKDVL